jgi:hypothetical protein
MRHYVHTWDDNGGVHLNSGIPNHAFYLAATAIGGNAWEKAGQIWYDTICDRSLRRSASFAAFAGGPWPMPGTAMEPIAPNGEGSLRRGGKSASSHASQQPGRLPRAP